MNKRLHTFLKIWVLPPGFLPFGRKIMSLFPDTTPEENAILARNARFNGRYAGRRCFVIGNGPSLDKQDLTPLGDEITIAMNSFNRHPVLKKWHPTFFCMGEPRDAYTSPEILRGYLKNIDAQAYFFPIETKDLFDEYHYIDPDKVYFLKMRGRVTTDAILDLTKVTPLVYNSGIFGTILALAMGCTPIYLLGMNYDWLSHRSLNRHFYGTDELYEPEEDLASRSYLSIMKRSVETWQDNETLYKIGLRHNQKIYNATEGGFLDTYPTITLAEALS